MMEFLTYPLTAAVILIAVLIFVHEFGHFIVGRLCGIGVEIFSIGFGPPIVHWKHKETDYRISWIPLGGYVKFYGMMPSEDTPEEMKGREFTKASLPRRALTSFAGPFANFLMAVLAYTVLAMSGIPHPQPIIGEIREGSVAQKSGLEFQDKIISMDGRPIKTWDEMREIISRSAGKEIKVTVERAGQQVTVNIVPDGVETQDWLGKKVVEGRIGIARGSLNSVVSIETADSAAAKAGLITGDEITEIKVNGAWVKVEYWQAFLNHLVNEIERGSSDIELKVKNGKTVTLKISPDVMKEIAPLKLKDRESWRTVAHLLGLTDSELTVQEASDAAKGTLEYGDRILSWNGKPVNDIYDLSDIQITEKNPEVKIRVQRKFEIVETSVKLKSVEIQKPSGKDTAYILSVEFLGQPIDPEPYIERYGNIFSAGWYGISEASTQSVFLVGTLGSLITGHVPLKALGGPLLIAKVAGDSAKAGWKAFSATMAIISINLAVLNLFPIPVLDGGQLCICAFEGARRKRLSTIAIENFQKIGFVMILALVLLATYNDISRFWTSLLKSITGFFQ